MGACDFSVSRDAAARRRSAGRGESSREAPSFADNFSAADAHVKDSAKRGAQTHRESARGDGIIGTRFAGASARRRRTRGLSGSRRRQGEPPTSPGAPAAGGQLPHNASEAFFIRRNPPPRTRASPKAPRPRRRDLPPRRGLRRHSRVHSKRSASRRSQPAQRRGDLRRPSENGDSRAPEKRPAFFCPSRLG